MPVARLRGFAVLSLLLAAFLVLSVFTPVTSADANTTSRQERIAKALKIAKNQRGDDYNYGSSGPGRFDCSGLLYYSLRKAGFSPPRSSHEQARWANRIKRKNMQKGDFVFFHHNGSVYHAAIFAGWDNGRRMIVHASSGADRVLRSTIYSNSWFPGTLRK